MHTKDFLFLPTPSLVVSITTPFKNCDFDIKFTFKCYKRESILLCTQKVNLYWVKTCKVCVITATFKIRHVFPTTAPTQEAN